MYFSHSSHAFSVPASTPALPETTIIAASAALIASSTSPVKSRYPGVSNTLILTPSHSIGITDVWLPPAYKCAGGKFDAGYAVYDLYDLGEFDQKGSIETKYGTKDEYLNAIQILHESNIKVLADIVLNHKMGADSIEEVLAIQEDCNNKGQAWTQVNTSIYGNLTVGSNNNSAYNEVRNQLYQCSSYNESITVQAMPIYYLEPNTRITVIDPASGIGGDYIIKSISLPLTVNGTMSLSCTRALQRI